MTFNKNWPYLSIEGEEKKKKGEKEYIKINLDFLSIHRSCHFNAHYTGRGSI